MMSADEVVVFQFNDAINAGSVESLADVMDDAHRFIDSSGLETAGKDACLAAWLRFFVAFPDYKNIVERIGERDDVILMQGRSTCSNPSLDGPVLWRARVQSGLVTEWQVFDDDLRTRRRLGFDTDHGSSPRFARATLTT